MSLSLQQKRAIREQASTKNGTSEIINYYNTHVTKQKDLLTYFKEIAPNTLLVHHLVALGQVKILASLIEDNISLIVLADTEEDTPLHYAVNYGQTRAAKLLLDSDNIPRAAKKGELPLTDYVNSDGLTPIDIAGLSHDGTLIELLNNYAIRFEREKSAIERRENNPRTANIFYSYPSSSHPRQSTIHFPIPSFSLPIETPLGPNPSWRDVSCLPEYDWLSKPTGQIQWKDLSSTTYDQNVSQQRWGSGCLFTDSLFLTAGHCVAPQKGTNGGWKVIDYYTQKPLPTPALAPLMTVNFNYQLGACPLPDSVPNTDNIFEEKFNILGITEYQLGNLDYAILELEGNPGKKYGKVNLSTQLPKNEEQVVVAQHPAGLVKKIDRGPVICEANTVNCGATGRIHYKLDTQGGSSGAPVALVENKTVIGVHTNGFGAKDIQANSAVTINEIKKVSRILNDSRLGLFPQPLAPAKKEPTPAPAPVPALILEYRNYFRN